MSKLLCYSENDFKEVMRRNNWYNCEDLPETVAIISIIGTKECRDYYSEEESSHYFKTRNNQILNLEFDDITEDVMWEGHLFKAMTKEQAREAVSFIKKNLGKDFYIHCKAGKSRSQAFVRFILDSFPGIYNPKLDINISNPCLTPNIDVLAKLKQILWLEG